MASESGANHTPVRTRSLTNQPTARTSPDERIPGFLHQDVVTPLNRASEPNELSMLVTVQSDTPWGFDMTRANVVELFRRVSGQDPFLVEFLGDSEILITMDESVSAVVTAMRLAKIKTWQGKPVEFKTLMASEAELRLLAQEKERSRVERREIDDRLRALLRERDEEIAQIVQHFEEKVETLEQLAQRFPPPETQTEVLGQRGPQHMGRESLRFPLFSGTDPPQKGEVRFEHWQFEVNEALRVHHPERVREGLVKSLRGNAADIVRHLGVGSSLEQIMERLVLAFETISEEDILLQEYYRLNQESVESVQEYSVRLEAALEKIRIRYPRSHPLKDASVSLKERLFHGLRKEIRDSIRFRYEDGKVKYQDLLAAARKAEAEGGPKKTVKVNSKATKVAHGFKTAESDQLGSQLGELLTTLKSLNLGNPQKGGKGKGRKPEEKGSSDPKQGYSAKNWKRKVRCYRCGGWGHISKECSSHLNSKAGGPSEGTPQKDQDQKDSSRAGPEEEETQSQTSQ